MSELSARPVDSVVGIPAVHESASLHVTGRAMYTDDLAAQTAGVLTAWPVQSTNAHARVTVDVTVAYRVPGVVHVLTAGDVPGLNAAIRAVVKRGEGEYGHTIIGFRNGWRGVVDGFSLNEAAVSIGVAAVLATFAIFGAHRALVARLAASS